MSYINTNTMQYPISMAEIKAAYPLTGFPTGFEQHEEFSLVHAVDAPTFDSEAEKLSEGVPQLVDGRWQQVWSVVPLSAEELAVKSEYRRARVNDERDRRISAGITFNGVRYQTRPDDRENIAGATQAAFMAIVAGAQAGDYRWSSHDADFYWIAEDNTHVLMDAQTVVAFGNATIQHKSALIYAANAIKQMDIVPVNFRDDEFWP